MRSSRDRDGRLYLGSGSTCDSCKESNPRSAAIRRFGPTEATCVWSRAGSGIRNGLVFAGRTLYATVNGKDKLGDTEPAETVVRVTAGADFGWPNCWPSYALERLIGTCSGVSRPVAYLEPHSSADGIASWRGDLFVAEWGVPAPQPRPAPGADLTRPRNVVRNRLRPPAGARRRPQRRPAGRRLGPRCDLRDQEAVM